MSTISVPFHRLAVNTPTIELVGYATGNGGLTVTVSAGTWNGSATVDSYGRFSASVPVSVGENTIQATVTDGNGETANWGGAVVRLITDRQQADLDLLEDLLSAHMEDWTAAELAEFNLARSRGAYNYTDLNRVSAATELVYQSLVGQGFVVDYDPVTHERPQPGRLPDGYMELEYIESTGTQYIDTGFKPNQDTRVILDVQLSQTPTDHNWFYGARQAVNNSGFGFFWNISSDKFGGTYGNSQVDITSNVSMFARLTVDQNQNQLLFNGQIYTFPTTTFQAPVNLPLLARNTNGTIAAYTTAKLWSAKIFDDGQLIRDFVPCKNPSGAVGLFDTVNSSFYGNSGSGVFQSGPEVVVPPVITYTWIESDTPNKGQMDQYLGNVANLLVVRLVQRLVTLPEGMDDLTLDGTNNIELALAAVDAVTTVARKSYIYSGEAMAGEF